MVKKYSELYLDARRALLETDGDYASNMARELLSAASGKTTQAIIADRDLYASEEICARSEDYVRRHIAGEPIAYIIGEWNFYDMTLAVTPDVLIPRDDTMAVTELAIRKTLFLPQNPRVLDLCTGCGCIGLAIAKRVKDVRVTLADVSQSALRVAKKNVADQQLSGRITCVQVDARKTAPAFLGKFDLIVANPPYISGKDMQLLDASVRDYEPHLALYGGEDGLYFFRQILDNFTQALQDDGCICFEFGKGQENDVCRLLEEHGFTVLELKKDNSDITRAVIAQRKGEK